MKVIFALMLVTLVDSCLAQKQDSITGGSVSTRGSLFSLDRMIEIYSDSLNYFDPESDLPMFLSRITFDSDEFAWLKTESDKVRYYSMRKFIFNRVFNKDVLIRIIKSDNRDYDMLYNPNTLITLEYKQHTAKLIWNTYVS
jgi:hypothetical protein